MPTRSTSPRRRPALAVAGALAVAVLVVVAGPAVLAGTTVGRAALGSTGCAAAADQIQVGLVIDFGTVGLDGQPSTPPSSQCNSLPANSTGIDLLVAAGHSYRPKMGGLGTQVCAIDGYPKDGCGVQNPDGTYDYWSYWTGSGSTWTYSGVGADRQLANGDVDGWHFVAGMGSDQKYAPRADPAKTCPPPPPTTTTPPTTAPGPGPGGATGPGSGGGGRTPTFHVTPTIPAGTSGQSTSPSDVTNDTIRGQALTEAESATSIDGQGFDTVPDGTDPQGSRNELASGEPGSPDGGSSSGSGFPIAVAGGGVVIVALGAVAVLRLRTKPED